MALSYLIALRDGISKNAATMASALRDLSQAMRETQREVVGKGKGGRTPPPIHPSVHPSPAPLPRTCQRQR
jgi:hypothetical protein